MRRLTITLNLLALVSIAAIAKAEDTPKHDPKTLRPRAVEQGEKAKWPILPDAIWKNYNVSDLTIEATVINRGDVDRHAWAKVKVAKILRNGTGRKIDMSKPLNIVYDVYEPVPPDGNCVIFLKSGSGDDDRWFLLRVVNHRNVWKKPPAVSKNQ